MKRGFTLVELSIVLVIIGLLIGGILAAQSMINTAKVQSFIRQIQQFDIAVANFRTKFGGLPGDTTAMACTNGVAPGGNICGNGVVEDIYNDQSWFLTVSFAGETINFWPQLQQSGFLSSNGATYSPTLTLSGFTLKGSSPNSPQMPLGNNTGVMVVFVANSLFSSPSICVNDCNYYLVGDFSSLKSGVGNNFVQWQNHPKSGGINGAPFESIPAVDALAIDTKIDDGSANGDGQTNANVIDLGAMEAGNVANGGPYGCTSDVNGDVYNISDVYASNSPAVANNCVLAIKMLSTNGMGNQ